MLVYNHAFDMYHTVYRMVNILTYHKNSDYVEIDRLRIWDFYFLFPEEVQNIRLTREEKDVKNLIKQFVKTTNNPYRQIMDSRKLFEKIRPYQMNALKCLASYGVINDDYISTGRVKKIPEEVLLKADEEFRMMREVELNVLKLMTSHFHFMPLYGVGGLKERTGLLEFKYDA